MNLKSVPFHSVNLHLDSCTQLITTSIEIRRDGIEKALRLHCSEDLGAVLVLKGIIRELDVRKWDSRIIQGAEKKIFLSSGGSVFITSVFVCRDISS